MVTAEYRASDSDEKVYVSVPEHMELPNFIRVRNPEEDYRDYKFWFAGRVPIEKVT